MTQEELESMCEDIIIDINNEELKHGLEISDWNFYELGRHYNLTLTISYEYQSKHGYDELFIFSETIPAGTGKEDYDDIKDDIVDTIKGKLIRYFNL